MCCVLVCWFYAWNLFVDQFNCESVNEVISFHFVRHVIELTIQLNMNQEFA